MTLQRLKWHPPTAVASQIVRAFRPDGSVRPIGTPRKANQNGEPPWPMKANWHLRRSDGPKSRLPVLLAALAPPKCHPNDSKGRGAVPDGVAVAQSSCLLSFAPTRPT